MIGQIITDKDGNPLDNAGNKLSESAYQPSDEIKKLFARVQKDYQVAWALQHRSFDEFDGVSLLQRAKMDQETFGAFVGAEWVAPSKRWRFRGRKNTARNKIIGILAHVLAGMLYPFVYAKNEKDEEDKMTARVMRMLVEDHLRKAGYEIKFLFQSLSALVNPAVFVEVEWVEVMQRIKEKMAGGKFQVSEVVDDLLSGLNLNILPIDEVLLPDFYSGTGQIQTLPVIITVRRIPYDLARGIYQGKFFDEKGKDLFDYVQAGQTRIVTGNQGQTLFDIEWTEADRNYVQVIKAKYRSEDLETVWVGGVFMGNLKDVYNSNPFKHRRFCKVGGKWRSIPVYNLAMSGFEPIDPSGRFAFYKSGAFKEYWDDQALNIMQRLAVDATNLDVMKPIFLSGISKVDSTVLAPGATIGMPGTASVTPFTLNSNIKAIYDSIAQQTTDMSESTQDKIGNGVAEQDVTATATNLANQQARIFLGVFGLMIADLVQKVGELTMDCIIQHSTVGELDYSVPEALRMKYKSFLIKGQERGRKITNKVVFTDKNMGKKFTQDQVDEKEWSMYNSSGKTPEERDSSDQRIYEVNPYQFARYVYSMFVDPDKIIKKSAGTDKQENILAFNMLTDPRVAPFTDQEAVVNDFAIEEYGGDDPERYKKKGNPNDMMNAVMGQGGPQNPKAENYQMGGGKVVPSFNEGTQ